MTRKQENAFKAVLSGRPKQLPLVAWRASVEGRSFRGVMSLGRRQTGTKTPALSAGMTHKNENAFKVVFSGRLKQL
jgi:hypothetical protein